MTPIGFCANVEPSPTGQKLLNIIRFATSATISARTALKIHVCLMLATEGAPL